MAGGRPSKYQPEFVKQAEKLCALAATDAEIADFFDVSVATIYRWKNEHPEFCDALKVGKETADNRVERSLFNRAIGYQHPDMHVSTYEGEVILTPIVKVYPPDTTAAIFWLKNRKPDEWRDKSTTEVTGKDGGAIQQEISASADATRLLDDLARLKAAPGAQGGVGSGSKTEPASAD